MPALLLGVLFGLAQSGFATEPPPAVMLAADSDGDGQSDVVEWFTHTSGTNRSSVLKIESIRRLTGPARTEITWQSVVGRPYEILRSSDLENWTSVTSLPAATSTTSTVTRTEVAGPAYFYRVASPYNESQVPLVSNFTLDHNNPLTQAASVRLNLHTYHPQGVTAVLVCDGSGSLGYATRQSQMEWTFDWPVDERNNGSHSFWAVVIAPNGVSVTSNLIPFTISVPARQHRTIREGLELSAASITQNGNTITASGNVRIGTLTAGGTAAVTWNLDTGYLTGSGQLLDSTGDVLLDAPWSLDATRDEIDGVPPVTTQLEIIPGYLAITNFWRSPHVAGDPRSHERGRATLSGDFPGRHPFGTFALEGEYSWYRTSGRMFMKAGEGAAPVALGSGVTVANWRIILSNLTRRNNGVPLAAFLPVSIRGNLHFPAGRSGPAVDIKGRMQLKFPVTPLDPAVPPLVMGKLVGSNTPVKGLVDVDGSFQLVPVPPQPRDLLDALANWVALGPDGLPQEGVRVIADGLGNLPPCEWRPVSSHRRAHHHHRKAKSHRTVKGHRKHKHRTSGRSGTIALRFPAGLRMTKPGGETVLEFLHMQLVAAEDCPLRFRQRYEVHSATPLTLGMDAPSVAEILGVLGLNPTAGLQVRLHDKFDFTIKSGALNPAGIAGAVLDIAGGLFDLLPDPGLGFPNTILTFQTPDFTDIPCQWPASLPAGAGGVPVYFSSGNAPSCNLRLGADGSLTVSGRAKVSFGNSASAPSFSAEINGSATQLAFELRAEDLDIGLSSSWTLPSAETLSSATTASDAVLSPLAQALRAKVNAYERKAVTMIERATPATFSGSLPRPDYADLFRRQGQAALDAFANAAIADGTLAIPAKLTDAITQAGRAVRSAPDFGTLIEVWFVLEQLAIGTGSTLQPLVDARAAARNEITTRLQANAEVKLAVARRMVDLYALRERLRTETGRVEDDPGVLQLTKSVFEAAIAQLSGALDITTTTLTDARLMLVENPKVRAMGLAETLITAETLAAIVNTLDSSNISQAAAILLAMCVQNAADLLTSELDEANFSENTEPTFEEVFLHYVMLNKWQADGDVQNVDLNLSLADLVTVEEIADLGEDAGTWTVTRLRNLAERADHLVDIRQNLPAGVTPDTAALTAFSNQVQTRIDGLWPQLASLSPAELLALLESGIRHARLRDELGLGDGITSWESTQRLSALIDRLCVLADSARSVEMLDTLKEAGHDLLDEAERFADLTVPNQNKRKYCLLEAEKIAFRLRALADAWFANNVPPVPFAWGSLLSIENAAAGFTYDVAAASFSGWASGAFKVPNLGSSLTLRRAEFSSDGSATLDVSVGGLPGFPGFTTVNMFGSITAAGVWSLSTSATNTLSAPSSLTWAVPIQNNATLLLDNNRARINVSVTSGTTRANGTITTDYSSGTPLASFSGTLSIDPLVTGIVSIAPFDPKATKLDLTIGGGNTATLSGAKCLLGAPFNVSSTLPVLTLDPSYNFSAAPTQSSVATTVNNYAWQAFQWSVKRVGGALAIEAPRFSMAAVPGFEPATIQFPAHAANTISTNGTFNFGMSEALPEIKVGEFLLHAPLISNGSATMASGTGMTLGGSIASMGICKTPAPPTPGAPVPYLSVSIPADPNVNTNFHTFNCRPMIGGRVFGDSILRLERVAGQVRLAFTAGNLTLPGGGPTLPSFNGYVTSDGLVNLAQNYSGSLYAFPMSVATSFRMNRRATGGRQMLIDDGAEALWKLDETATGASVQDATGKGHSGSVVNQPTVNAPPACPGSGASYSFDGVDEGVTISDHANLEGGTAMSVEAWFKVSVLKSGWQTIISKGDNAWRLAIHSDDAKLNFDTNSSSSSNNLKSVSTFNNSNWHHFVATFDGTTKRVYIDGTLEASVAWSGPIQSNAYPVMIGENAQATGRRWQGSIDEAAFYRRALSAAEVAAHYGGERPEGWWRLDEQGLWYTLQVADCGNGHPGTAPGSGGPTINQPTALSGQSGGSYRFDGINDAVTIADHDNLEGGNAMTVAAWFKVNVMKTGWQTIISKGDNTWRLAIHGGDQKLNFDTNSTTSSHNLKSTSTFNDSAWHHVVATFDGSRKLLYIDGVLEASATWSGPIQSNAYAVMIGENAQSVGRYWDGWIDDVLFYRRALTPAHALELFESGNGVRFSFAGTADLHSTFRPAFSGSIGPDGSFDAALATNATQVLAGPSFTNLDLHFRHQGATTSFGGSGQLSPLPVVAGNPITINGSPEFNITLERSGSNTLASISATGVTAALCGYSVKAPGFNLSLAGNLGTSQLLGFSDFKFGPFGSSDLTDIGFTALSGTINTATGALTANVSNQPLNLRNMIASNTTVNFNNSGLSVSAPFELKTTINMISRTWANITFSGSIPATGSYDLGGHGALTFGGHVTDACDLRFRSPDLGGTVVPATGVTPSLNYGSLGVPLTSFVIHQNGLSLSGQKVGSKAWSQRSPLPIEDYLYWVIDFSFDFANNTINGGINGSTDWKWKGIYPGGARGGEHVIKLNGSVGSDGILPITGARIASGSWPVNLLDFGGTNGWSTFAFDGSSGIPAFPQAPPRGRLW